MKYLLGKKIAMTQVYNEKGKSIPVTVVEAGPVYVTQIRKFDNFATIQVGYEETKHLNKPETGHLKSQKIDKPLKNIKEYHISLGDADKYEIGQEINVSIFEKNDKIDVSGRSKGKGFAGTIKRHNFNTGPKTHGSNNYRQPGSIGCAYPQRVIKGTRMAGHMGYENITVKKLKIIEIHPEKNLLVISGPVPGYRGTLLTIKGL